MIRHARRIYLIDDTVDSRELINRWMLQDPRIIIMGAARTLDRAIQDLENALPDLLILNIGSQPGVTMDFIRRLRSQWPSLNLLVFSDEEETIYAERVLRLGANGYLMKSCEAQEFHTALNTILRGDLYVSPIMENRILQTLAGQGELDKREPSQLLSNRELEVFVKIGQGTTSREIARQLGLSIKTIETHRAHIKRKMHIESSRDLSDQARDWLARSANVK